MAPIHHASGTMMSQVSRRRILTLLGALPAASVLAGCTGIGDRSQPEAVVDFAARFAQFETADEPNGDLAKVVWPEFITGAGGDIRALYEFQILNGDLMRYMPCFCGCNREDGHRSNRDCYVEAVNADGSVVFDSMAPT